MRGELHGSAEKSLFYFYKNVIIEINYIDEFLLKEKTIIISHNAFKRNVKRKKILDTGELLRITRIISVCE